MNGACAYSCVVIPCIQNKQADCCRMQHLILMFQWDCENVMLLKKTTIFVLRQDFNMNFFLENTNQNVS